MTRLTALVFLAACGASTDDLTALDARVAAIEADLDPTTGLDLSALSDQVTALDARVTSLEGSAATADDLATLRADLDAVELDIVEIGDDMDVVAETLDGLDAADASFESRTAGLEQALANHRSELDALDDGLDAANGDLEIMATQLGALSTSQQGLGTDLTDLDDRLADLEQQPAAAITFPNATLFSGPAPTTWTSLSTEAYFGNGRGVAILRVDHATDSNDGQFAFRAAGASDGFELNSLGANLGRVRNQGVAYPVVATNTTGGIEWNTSFSSANNVTVHLVAVIK
jgi:uncharacterized coiled-coil protein SlyX